jgi:hypothetical protein
MNLRLFFIVAGAAGIGGVFYIAAQAVVLEKQVHTADFFSVRLAEATTVPITVSVGKTSYEVRGGIAYLNGEAMVGAAAAQPLSLAYQKVFAAQAPLLGLPGVDPEHLFVAVENLSETAAQLAALQETPAEAYWVETALYPLNLLSSVAALERARQTFLETGQAEHAREYSRAVAAALREYRASLQRFKAGFVAVVPHEAKAYGASRAVISRESVLELIGRLERNSRYASSLLATREACFSGALRACTERPVLPELPAAQRPAPGNVGLAQEIYPLTAAAEKTPQQKPLVQLHAGACAPAPVITATYEDRVGSLDTGSAFMRVLPVSDLLFLRPAEYADTVFFGYFNARGLTYVPAYASYYQCLELGEDAAATLTTLAVREFARKTALGEQFNDRELRQTEAELTGDVIPEASAYAYLSRASAHRPALSAPLAAELTELILRTRNHNSALPEQVLEVAAIENLSVRLASKGPAPHLTAAYLFFVRSHLLSFFLTHDPLLTGSEPLLQYSAAPAWEAGPFVRYSAMEDPIEKESARADALRYREIIRQLDQIP